MKFRKSSLTTKLVVAIIIVYSMVTLVSLQQQVTDKRAQADQLADQIETVQEANAQLQQGIDALGTDAGVENTARSDMGLVKPGEIIFYDVGE